MSIVSGHGAYLHTAHEQIRDPETIEKITGAAFLLAVILP
jgi:hypothetical protein